MNKIIKGADLSEDSFAGDTFKSNLNLNMGDSLFSDSVISETPETIFLDAHGSDKLELPSTDFVTDAQIQQTGMDLHLVLPDGSAVVIVGYFAEAVQPELTTPSGASLTPSLVESFKTPDPSMMKLAQAGDGIVDGAAGDSIGSLEFMSGEVFAVRTDGSRVQLQLGDPVYQGDQIETSPDGAVKIKFVDETIFTLGEDARLALDELVFDPSATSGSSAFSILKGSFVFVSGQIAHDNYDNMEVTTPVATIGIRGTTVTGSVLIGDVAFTFSVLEGSIAISAGGETLTLSESFATAIGNLSPSGRIEIAQSPTDQAAVMRSSNKALTALGDSDLKKLEQTIEKEIEEQTGEKVDLDLKAEIAAAAEAPEPEVAPTDGEQTGDGPQGEPGPGDVPPPGEGPPDGATGTEEIPEEILLEIIEEEPEKEPEPEIILTIEQPDEPTPPPPPPQEQDTTPVTPVTSDPVERATSFDFSRSGQAVVHTQSANDGKSDTVIGSDYNDTITTLSGNDTISGGMGDDTLYAGTGDDIVNGGTGVDYIHGEAGNDTLNGGDGDDFIYGNDGVDTLFGNAGSDRLFGGAGNDHLDGGDGDDTLEGNDGDDVFEGRGGHDLFYGGTGGTDTVSYVNAAAGITLVMTGTQGGNTSDDGDGSNDQFTDINTVIGSAFADSITGENGDDTFSGGAGNDILIGLAGDDVLNGGSGNDTFVYEAGNDEYHGDAGTDLIDLSGAAQGAVISGIAGTIISNGETDTYDGIESFYGTQHDDSFTGGASDDTFSGLSGIDTLSGGGGNDTLTGGDANYILNGDDGNDTLFGGAHDDILDGGAGDDFLYGEAGNDDLYGGAGTDTYDGGADVDTLSYLPEIGGNGITVTMTALGAGTVIDTYGDTDTILGIETINGSSYGDVYTGSAAQDKFYGNGGDDVITVTAGSDTYDGQAGTDTLDFVNATSGLTYNLSGAGSANIGGDGFGGTITFYNVEVIHGSGFNDTITGNSGDDIFYGMDADDILNGNAGNDKLYGGNGNDSIIGGTGDDILDGGAGNDDFIYEDGTDQYIGRTGSDILVLTAAAAAANINVATGSIVISGVTDTISGIETIVGTSHADTFTGDSSSNIFFGEAGNDTINAGDGDDKVYGGDGIDTIHGDNGNDIIVGGAGADTLDGDAGNDIFFYDQATDSDSTNTDTISDFNIIDDKIYIDKSLVTGVLTNGSFANGGGSFVGGGLASFHMTGTTLYLDTDGVGGIDMKFNLGVSSVNASNIVVSSAPEAKSSLTFDGTTDHIRMQDNQLNGMTEGTIAAWVKLDDIGGVTGSPGTGSIITSTQLDGVSSNGVFGVGLRDGGLSFTATAGQLVYHASNGTGSIYSDATITAGEWHHVAIVFSGSSATFYIDGVADTSVNTGADYSIGNVLSSSGGSNIHSAIGSIGNGDHQFDGELGDVAVWDSQLTQSDITEYYNDVAGPAADAYLRFHYTFDDGTATNVNAPGTYDGMLAGSTLPTQPYNNVFLDGQSAITPYSDLIITDTDSTNIESASIQIGDFAAGDILSASTSGTSISAAYDASTGLMTFSSSDTLANYQQVIRGITFEATASVVVTTPRSLNLTLDDGVYNHVDTPNVIDVRTSNAAPVEAISSFTVNPGSTYTGQLFTDSDGDILSASVLTATNGNVLLGSDGTITYVAESTGTETISYTITDGFDTISGSISVNVVPV